MVVAAFDMALLTEMSSVIPIDMSHQQTRCWKAYPVRRARLPAEMTVFLFDGSSWRMNSLYGGDIAVI